MWQILRHMRDDAATPASTDTAPGGVTTRPARRRHPVRDALPVLLVRAAHPRQAVLTALALAVAALFAGRPTREVLLVLGTVLVGQIVLGWHNDLVDRERDARHERPGKPVADGRLDPGTLWFAVCCAVLVLVPLAVANGILAGSFYLASVLIGLLGNLPTRLLRTGLLSWLPWAASFALYAPFLSYGGWGGQAEGDPPHLAMVGLAALAGVGVHHLCALWGLVADHEDGWTYLPLRIGLRIGATRLLIVSLAFLAAVVVALALVGRQVGL